MSRYLATIAVALGLAVHVDAGGALACQGGRLRVAIDVGHSKRHPGAESASGKFEYHFNERFARELVGLSKEKPRLSLFIVNPQGEDLRLTQRTQRAAARKADLFVSVHHDSVNDKYVTTWRKDGKTGIQTNAFHGYSLFVSSANANFSQSKALARLIGRKLKEAGFSQTLHHAEPIRGENRRLLDWALGVYDAPFTVLKTASSPAVLVEVGVLPNRAEEELLDVPEYRQRIAVAILDAIAAYCK